MSEPTDSLKTHEATKRVLYHVVATYQTWRNNSLGLPNELSDDAVKIAEQHLRDVDWFPAAAGWLPDNVPHDGTKVETDPVLDLIDEELDRLRNSELWPAGRFSFRRRAWVHGVNVAKTIAAERLQKIRDAYEIESDLRQVATNSDYGIDS